MKIYLAGCGQIGKRLGKMLQGDGCQVVGLKRHQADFDFPVMALDLADKVAVNALPCDADAIIFTVTPSEYTEAGYAMVYDDILTQVIDWATRHQQQPLVLLVSSTGVYGQQNGEWVNEDSETQPSSFSGREILAGERRLRQRLQRTLTVRFSGIYGTNRTRLIQQASSGQAIQQSPTIWTNRIHEEDCVGILHFLLRQVQADHELAPIYLASDDCPVGKYEVSAFICETLGHTPPPVKKQDLNQQYNKRCDNQRIKSLGYRFRYQDYRQGYAAVIRLNTEAL